MDDPLTVAGVIEHDCKQEQKQQQKEEEDGSTFRDPIMFTMSSEETDKLTTRVKYTEHFEGKEQEDAPCVDTPQLFEQELDRYRPHIGTLFRNEEEFETFMRLPISNNDRVTLLQKLLTVKGSKRPHTV